jgi:aerobic-type carbon monoxide dehydrogenase small subunit (CoxS/CutS family)
MALYSHPEIAGDCMGKSSEELISLTVNSRKIQARIDANWTLAYFLRNHLGLTGTKIGCDGGACGACSVIVDGKIVPSCTMLAIEMEGKEILTIEGLSDGKTLHPIQEAWLEEHGLQCGFCTPGMILAAKVLLDRNPNPTEKDVEEALSGHICRCGNYVHIINSVLSAARKMRRKQNG